MALQDALDALRYGNRFRPQPVKEPEEEQPEMPAPLAVPKAVKEVPPPKTSRVFSALAGAANLLDVPGSMVRDVATWLPGGTVPHNPFNQLLHPFSDTGRVYGRDLLRDYGMAEKYDTWGNFGAGLAADIVTDPLSWATLGAVGAGRNVATKAGAATTKAGYDKMVKAAAKTAGRGEVPNARGLLGKGLDATLNAARKIPGAKKVMGEANVLDRPAMRPITERAARGQTTNRNIINYAGETAYEKLKSELMEKASREGADGAGEFIEEAARQYQADVARSVYNDLRKSYKGTDAEFARDLDLSVGGTIMHNLPFSNTGLQRGLPNFINSRTGRETFINGVWGAHRFDEAPEAIAAFDDMIARGRPLAKEQLDAFKETVKKELRGKAPPLIEKIKKAVSKKAAAKAAAAADTLAAAQRYNDGINAEQVAAQAGKDLGGDIKLENSPQVAAPEVTSDVVSQPVVGFKTSKGSTYEVNGTSTTRNKAYHPEHGRDDVGLKAPSEITYYVDPKEVGDAIGMHQALDADKAIGISNGRAYLPFRTDDTKPWGLSPDTKDGFTLYTEPRVGLAPLELWGSSGGAGDISIYKNWHPGNEIVEVFNGVPSQNASDVVSPQAVSQIPIDIPPQPLQVIGDSLDETKRKWNQQIHDTVQSWGGSADPAERWVFKNVLKPLSQGEEVKIASKHAGKPGVIYNIKPSQVPGHVDFVWPEGKVDTVRADKLTEYYQPEQIKAIKGSDIAPELKDKIVDFMKTVDKKHWATTYENIVSSIDKYDGSLDFNSWAGSIARNSAMSDMNAGLGDEVFGKTVKSGSVRSLDTPSPIGSGTLADIVPDKGAGSINSITLDEFLDTIPKGRAIVDEYLSATELLADGTNKIPSIQDIVSKLGVSEGDVKKVRNAIKENIQVDPKSVRTKDDSLYSKLSKPSAVTGKKILQAMEEAGVDPKIVDDARVRFDSWKQSKDLGDWGDFTGVMFEDSVENALKRVKNKSDYALTPDAVPTPYVKPDAPAIDKAASVLKSVFPDQQADSVLSIVEALAKGQGKKLDDVVKDLTFVKTTEKEFDDAVKSGKPLYQSSSFPFTQPDEMGFYSKTARLLDSKMSGPMQYKDLKQMLINNGAKQEELDDLGLSVFEGRKVTKDELAKHITENMPVMREVRRGDYPKPLLTDAELKRIDELEKTEYFTGLKGAEADEYSELIGRYHQQKMAEGAVPSPKFAEHVVPGGDKGSYREFVFQNAAHKGPVYEGGHFEPNVAHARVDTVTHPDGAREFRIQEVQSDWIQKAEKLRKEEMIRDYYAETGEKAYIKGVDGNGYTDEFKAWKELNNKDYPVEDYFYNSKSESELLALEKSATLRFVRGRFSEESGLSDEVIQQFVRDAGFRKEMLTPEERGRHTVLLDAARRAAIPSTAFKKSWHRMALKRLLHVAAKEGYDKVSIVNGSDIAKAVGGPVDSLTKWHEMLVNEMKGLTKKWKSYDTNSKNVVNEKGSWRYISASESGDDFNKYVAIDNQGRIHVIEEGYDSVDHFINGVLHGSLATIDEAMAWAKFSGIKPTVNKGSLATFNISPAMRKELLDEGQPLYQAQHRGAYWTDQGKAFIALFEGKANFSTVMHELAHYGFDTLSPELQAKAKAAYEVVGEWTIKQKEEFASDFETYMLEGKAPTKELEGVFAKIKKWMAEVYKAARSVLTQDRRDIFDAMLTPGGNVGKKSDVLYQTVEEAGADLTTKAIAQKEWLEKGTLSSFFRNWFGDWVNDPKNASKVVDGDGKPLVVYHGTNADFDTFSDGVSMFSVSPNYSYARRSDMVKPVYLDIKNPFYTTDQQYAEGIAYQPLFLQELEDQGYDGLIYSKKGDITKGASGWGNDYSQIAVFNSNQIKSAIGNSGEFNPNNSSILYQSAQEAASSSLKDTTGYRFAQKWGEYEEIVGESPVGRMLKYLFHAPTRGLSTKGLQKLAPETYEAEKQGEVAAREALAPMAQMWVKNKFLDERALAKEMKAEDMSEGVLKHLEAYNIDKNSKLGKTIAARVVVNKNVDQLFLYLEGLAEEVPTFNLQGEEAVKWKGMFAKLRDMFGGYEASAKEFAEKNDISIEDAREILKGDLFNAYGALGEEYDAGIMLSPLMDEYIKRYFPRQMSNLPPKNLILDIADSARQKELQWVKDKESGAYDAGRGPLIDTTHTSQKQRRSSLSDIPGGSVMARTMSVDKNISGIAHKWLTVGKKGLASGGVPPEKQFDAAAIARVRAYMKTVADSDPGHMYNGFFEPGNEAAALASGELTDEVKKQISKLEAKQKELDRKVNEAIVYMAWLDPRHAVEQVPIFSNDLFSQVLFRVQRKEQVKGGAAIMYGMIRQGAELRENVENVLSELDDAYKASNGHPTIEYFLSDKAKELKFNSIQARRNIVNILNEDGNRAEIVRNQIVGERMAKLAESATAGADAAKPVFFFDDYGHRISFRPVFNEAKEFEGFAFEKLGDDAKLKDYDLDAPKNEYNELTGAIEKIERNEDGSRKVKVLSPEDAVNRIEKLGASNKEVLDRFVLKRSEVEDYTKMLTPPQHTEAFKLFLKTTDKITNLWKSLHTGTLPFLSFHVRNRGSGGFANMLSAAGKGDPSMHPLDPRRYINPMRASNMLYRVGGKLNEVDNYTSKAEVLLQAGKMAEANKLAEKMRKANDFIIATAKKLKVEEMPHLSDSVRKFSEATNKAEEVLVAREQIEAFQSSSFVHELTGGKQGVAAEQLGKNQDALANQIPGVKPFWSEPPSDASRLSKWFDFTRQKGVRGEETAWRPGLHGEDLSRYVEHQNRVSPYIALLWNGYSADEAARIVKKAQVDYTQSTPFEKNIARRLFPFYTFSSGAARYYGSDLLNRPGGLTGQTLRAMNESRDEDALAPEHILETTAIPLGESQDGTRNYVTGFGLGFEDPVNLVTPALSGNFSDFGRELLSRSNPLIKGAVEGSTGVSTFQRGPFGARYLEDMDPTLGRTVQNVSDLVTGNRTETANPLLGSRGLEFAFENSPVSRYTGFARTLTDPRKIVDNPLYTLLNLGTGVRVNQVSPGAQDAIERGRIAKEIKDMGGRNFETPYFPDYKEEGFDEEEAKKAEQLLARLKELAKRAKERRIARKHPKE